ncbi:MAG: hypothetical protein AABY15_02630 [Nanoarchaeota archaeon]
MKKIEIDGLTLYYEVEYHEGLDNYSYPVTEFYLLKGKKEEVKWSWRKFRYVKTGNMVDNYIDAFSLGIDIESPSHTKSDVRSMIERRVELLHREEEIKRGELI